ncbi:Spy/CpxP family protein refolding chaperone [Alcaligenaceae bacterium CGII-47]|nr:Spy/CpxP family protein refolding chaperone [Alcaligenaceae bacterium CGII-47]
MKKSLAISVLAATMALGAAPMASFAQGGGQCASHGSPDRMSMHRSHDGMQGRMFQRLDLSEAQRDQIFKIHHDQAPEMFKLKNSQRAAATKLRELSRAATFDEANAQALATELGQAQGQLALLRAKQHAQIQAVLTPEQREQLKTSFEQRRNGKHTRADPSTKS